MKKNMKYILFAFTAILTSLNIFADAKLSNKNMKGCRAVARTFYRMDLKQDARSILRFLKYLDARDKKTLKLIADIKKNVQFSAKVVPNKYRVNLAESLIAQFAKLSVQNSKWYYTRSLYIVIANLIDPENKVAIEYIVKEKTAGRLNTSVQGLITKSKIEKRLYPNVNKKQTTTKDKVKIVDEITNIEDIINKKIEDKTDKKKGKNDPEFYLSGKDIVEETKKFNAMKFTSKYRNKIIEIHAPLSSFSKSKVGYTIKLYGNIIELRIPKKMFDTKVFSEVSKDNSRVKNRRGRDDYFIDEKLWKKKYKSRKLIFAPLKIDTNNAKIERIYTILFVAKLAQGSSRKILFKDCQRIELKIEAKNDYYSEDEE